MKAGIEIAPAAVLVKITSFVKGDTFKVLDTVTVFDGPEMLPPFIESPFSA
jgi:hypothetical protein